MFRSFPSYGSGGYYAFMAATMARSMSCLIWGRGTPLFRSWTDCSWSTTVTFAPMFLSVKWVNILYLLGGLQVHPPLLLCCPVFCICRLVAVLLCWLVCFSGMWLFGVPLCFCYGFLCGSGPLFWSLLYVPPLIAVYCHD